MYFFFNRKPSYDTETDPSEGLMNVLKKIYEDGDDDMKRTINKAWVESREKQAKGDTDFWDFKVFWELWCGKMMFPIRKCCWAAQINLTYNYLHSLLLSKGNEFSTSCWRIYLSKICLLNTSSMDGFFSNQAILFKKSNVVFWCEM